MSNDRRGVRGIGKNESSEIVSGERATYSPRIKPLRRNETSGVFRPFRPNNCFLKTFWTEVRNQGAISGAHSLIKCSGLSNLIVDESASFASVGRGEEAPQGDFWEHVSRPNPVSNETLIFHRHKVNFLLEKRHANPKIRQFAAQRCSVCHYPWPTGQVALIHTLWHRRGMTLKKIIVLDPDASFERASRHLHKCRKCRNAGMEWARRKKLCRRGRQLLEDLERIERIYEGTELAA